MKIKDYKCKKCGCDNFFFSAKGENAVGIYCDKCGAWFKWADKDEKNLANKRKQSALEFINSVNEKLEAMQAEKRPLTTFDGLPAGTVLTSTDGDMTVAYSDFWSEDGEKEFCLADDKCLWRGCQFDPADWRIKELP